MVARISRPSAPAMGRGPGASREVGRIFWPSAADALRRHTATKMDRHVTLLSLADCGESRAGPAAKTTPSDGTGPFFCGGLGKNRLKTVRLETEKRRRTAIARMPEVARASARFAAC